MSATQPENSANSRDIPIRDIEIKTTDIHVPKKAHLPDMKLASLVNGFDHETAEGQGVAIHITSAYKKEGADHIAIEAAIFAAKKEEKSVLILDIEPDAKGAAIKYGLNPEVTLDAYILDGDRQETPFVNIANTKCVYAKIDADNNSSSLLFNTRQLKRIINEAKSLYDLVIIRSANALQRSTAATLAPLVESTIIAIKADRTRYQVVKELVDLVQDNGGKVTGTVMTNRRYYIPKLLYALFFNADNRD